MFTRFWCRKKLYKLSERNYLNDYSKIESKQIDMTLSGRYLSSYPNIDISVPDLDKYPLAANIRECEDLIKSKIKTKSEIIIGSGANGLLQNITKILFKKKGNLVTSFYSFDQVEYAVTSFGSITKRVYTHKYDLDIHNIINSIDKRTRMIYICNPNNPTGKFIEPKKLFKLSNLLKIPIVIDESGIEFSKHKGILEIIPKLPDNLFVVRSFSKAYGLANLRIGYLACSTKFKEKYLENITTNEYSGISCLIAKIMLNNTETYVLQNINEILKEKEFLIRKLEKIGIKVIKSYSNTIFTRTIFNKNFLNELEKNDISIVPVYDKCNNLHIRIAIQDRNTNIKFLKGINKILKDNNYILGEYEDE